MKTVYPLLSGKELNLLYIYIRNMFSDKSNIYIPLIDALARAPIRTMSNRLGDKTYYVRIDEAIQDGIFVKGRFRYELNPNLITLARKLLADKDYYLSAFDVLPHRILSDSKGQKHVDSATAAVARTEGVPASALKCILTNTWMSADIKTSKSIIKAGLLVDREIGGCAQPFISERGADLVRKIISMASTLASEQQATSAIRREQLSAIFEARAQIAGKWRNRFARSLRLENFAEELVEDALAAERSAYMRRMILSGLSKNQVADELGQSPATMPSLDKIERIHFNSNASPKARLYGDIQDIDPDIQALVRYAKRGRKGYVKDLLDLFASAGPQVHQAGDIAASAEADRVP